MLVQLPAVLDSEQLCAARHILASGHFVDGRLSAGRNAVEVKNNQELAADDPQSSGLNNLVMGALLRHPVYQSAALPAHVAAPYYARYTEGMGYGDHVDDPVMGDGPRYRSDIAITIFLSEPDSYSGGELQINTSYGAQTVKLVAGDGVMYPASSRHQVNQVSAGERLVAVTWVQSLVKEPGKREILYELHQVREEMMKQSPDSNAFKKLDRVYFNLIRLWSEI